MGHSLFRVTVNGEENLPSGNYVVVANHLSWIDPFLLMVVLPAEPRLYFIGAQQALNRDWKEWFVRHFDVMIPFERGAVWVGKAVLQKPLGVLRAGAVLGLFPEGALGPQEGELQPLQRGIGHILLQADHPVLPIALSGVQELYQRKPITATIGKPIRISTEGLSHHAAAWYQPDTFWGFKYYLVVFQTSAFWPLVFLPLCALLPLLALGVAWAARQAARLLARKPDALAKSARP
jgi:1-acyl-sn-glycerol-3-phosphate acyltransferase